MFQLEGRGKFADAIQGLANAHARGPRESRGFHGATADTPVRRWRRCGKYETGDVLVSQIGSSVRSQRSQP